MKMVCCEIYHTLVYYRNRIEFGHTIIGKGNGAK